MVIDSEDDNAIAQVEKSQEISLLNSSIPLLSKTVSQFNSSERDGEVHKYTYFCHDLSRWKETSKQVMPHLHQKGTFSFFWELRTNQRDNRAKEPVLARMTHGFFVPNCMGPQTYFPNTCTYLITSVKFSNLFIIIIFCINPDIKGIDIQFHDAFF